MTAYARVPNLDFMPSAPQPTGNERLVSRRTLLEWLGKGAVLSLASASLASCVAHRGRPSGATQGVPGLNFAPGPSSDAIFANWLENTVDPQELPPILANWTLSVDGLVASPQMLSFADLLALPPTNLVMDFHCVEGWTVQDVPWNGTHISQLVSLVSPQPAATYLTFHCIGNTYSESLPLAVALEPHTFLGYGVGGNTLPLAHGFPVRLVIPRLYGYKNAKYLARIEFTDQPETGFWEGYGYSYDANVPPALLRDGKY